MAEAQLLKGPPLEVSLTAPAALASGQVLQLPDGRAGVVAGLKAPASGDLTAAQVEGIFVVAKTASINLLDGQEVWWDAANNTASYTGDFMLGVAVGDSLAAATTVNVDLNVPIRPRVSLDQGEWNFAAALGLGVVQTNRQFALAFDAVAEIAMAALYSSDAVDIDDGPIFEAWFAVFDIGDNAALDINIGLAVGTHATDFEAIAQFIAFQLDGNSLDINAHSDDGTTDTAPVDTTVNAVDNAWMFLQIDVRSKADPQLYIDGVNVLPATVFDISVHTGNLLPIVHIEKTSDNTLADVRVKAMHVRTAIKT